MPKITLRHVTKQWGKFIGVNDLNLEIEEAALIVGASWPKRMLRILLPIQKSAFISGYLLPFVSCMR